MIKCFQPLFPEGRAEGEEDGMPVTIRDIAEKAKVSPSVVSAILRGTSKSVRYSQVTAQRVLRLARKMGYRPHRVAQGLAMRRTLTVGISFAWEMKTVYQHPAMAFIIAGANEALGKGDYSLLLCPNPVGRGYLPSPATFHTNQVDGVLLVGAIRRDEKNLGKWRRYPLPMVLVSTPPEGIKGINNVDLDNFGASYGAVVHLVQRGFRRIGLVLPGLDYTCHVEQLKGFRQALSDTGLPFRTRWVWKVGYDPENGDAFARQFARLKDRPEALVFMAELAALGFGRAIMSLGWRVPDDLGLVVKEKYPGQMAMLSGVTVIEAPYFRLGAVAAETLLKLIEGQEKTPVEIRLPITFQES